MNKITFNVKYTTCKNAHIQKPSSNDNTAASTNTVVNVCLCDTDHRRKNPKLPPENPLLIVLIILMLLLLCSLSCAEPGNDTCALCATLLKVLGAIL